MVKALRILFQPLLAGSLLLPAPAASPDSLGNERKSDKTKAAVAQAVSKARIPGMVAAIASSKGILAIGSSGVRKDGAKAALTEDDHIHLGSCTKAMLSLIHI